MKPHQYLGAVVMMACFAANADTTPQMDSRISMANVHATSALLVTPQQLVERSSPNRFAMNDVVMLDSTTVSDAQSVAPTVDVADSSNDPLLLLLAIVAMVGMQLHRKHKELANRQLLTSRTLTAAADPYVGRELPQADIQFSPQT